VSLLVSRDVTCCMYWW